jgi:hypothetical protein
MKPIINPWWIYFASKSECVGEFLLMVCLCVLIGAIAWTLIYRIGECETSCPKWLLIIGIVGTIIGGLLPSEKTIYTMMTVEQITPNNIEAVGNTAQDIVDYIVDKIDEVMNSDNKDKKDD